MSVKETSERPVADFTDESDVELYLPGTPTASFLSWIEYFVGKLTR